MRRAHAAAKVDPVVGGDDVFAHPHGIYRGIVRRCSPRVGAGAVVRSFVNADLFNTRITK